MQERVSHENKKVAVIGAGIFGCNVALALAKAGYHVTMLERLSDILMGTSKNNTNRVHQGFHYPRDTKTATECRDNYSRFEKEFQEVLLENYPNIYCIAESNSLTSKDDFLDFCSRLGLSYNIIDLDTHGVRINACNLGLSCQETIIDADALRENLRLRIRENEKIAVSCQTDVAAIEKKGHQFELSFLPESLPKQSFDAVVNCSYANINTLTLHLGYEVRETQYEYTVVPIISLEMPPNSITIMDGPFMTLFPYGKTGKFLLYHVDYSVVKTEIAKTLNQEWLDAETAPFHKMDQEKYFKSIVDACARFVPALADARLCGYLQAPRMVLPRHEQDDARPSLINDYGEGYLTVFSGKIDRSLDIADTVCCRLNAYFENVDGADIAYRKARSAG